MKTSEEQINEWRENEKKVKKMYCEEHGKKCVSCDNTWCENYIKKTEKEAI